MIGPVELSVQDKIARVTLNRPDAANTISLALARRMADVAEHLHDAAPRAVIISGRGRMFCAGGDVKEMSASADLSAHLRELADTFHSAIVRIRELDAVIIAAIQGAAAGGGLGLALNADIRVTTPDVRFLSAYEQVGLTPDSGVSYLLPRIIGGGRASAITALGLVIDADTARDWGLATEVVPADDLDSRVAELAEAASTRTQDHMAATRALLAGDIDGAYARVLAKEATNLAAAGATATTKRLIDAFAGQGTGS